MIEVGLAALIWIFVVIAGCLAVPFVVWVVISSCVLAYVLWAFLKDQAQIWIGHRRRRRHARWSDKR